MTAERSHGFGMTNQSESSELQAEHRPRDCGGKEKSSRNAFRHGLSRPMLGRANEAADLGMLGQLGHEPGPRSRGRIDR